MLSNLSSYESTFLHNYKSEDVDSSSEVAKEDRFLPVKRRERKQKKTSPEKFNHSEWIEFDSLGLQIEQ